MCFEIVFEALHVFILSTQTSEGSYLQKEQKTSFLLQTESACICG